MKKASNNLNPARNINLNGDNRREDHFSYFENLEQKLLNESDKLTNLISVVNPTSEIRSLQNSVISSSSNTHAKLAKSKHQ